MNKTLNEQLLELLNLTASDDIVVENTELKDGVKYVDITKKLSPHICPICHQRMESLGLYHRTVNHPVFQDGLKCTLNVKGRKWKCYHCGHYQRDTFPFLEKYKHSTSITPLLVLEAMKDLNRSAAGVGRQFNLSDTQVHDIFSQYVDLPRLELREYMSIDEVYLNIKPNSLYAFVIMDFATGEIVDIVHNRWSSTLDDYFYHIPREEREKVRGIISDAYDPYQSLCEKFFPNAVMILDSFHAVSYLTRKLNEYIYHVQKRYQEKQKKLLEANNLSNNTEYNSIKDSEEIILLRDYRWVLLRNKANINYSIYPHHQRKLKKTLTTNQIEKMFFKLDDKFEQMRELKEKYISFNSIKHESEDSCRKELQKLIDEFSSCKIRLFEEFAEYLKVFTDNIIRSFTTVEVSRKKDPEKYYARLSNGPMESFNRKPKDYKRNSRGSSNFDYTRNRILWSTRKDPTILAEPKPLEVIHSYKLNKKTLWKRRKNKKNR